MCMRLELGAALGFVVARGTAGGVLGAALVFVVSETHMHMNKIKCCLIKRLIIQAYPCS